MENSQTLLGKRILMQPIGVKFRVSVLKHLSASGIRLLQGRWSLNLHNMIAIATFQANRQISSRSGFVPIHGMAAFAALAPVSTAFCELQMYTPF
jgi:hypothetical protein